MKTNPAVQTFLTLTKYAYLPAIACGLAGAIALGITGIVTPLYGGLLVAGGGFFILWLIGFLWRTGGFWRRRSTQSGANVLLSTLAMVAILGVINFVAFRYPVTWDLTENQRFTLAPQTQSLLQSLEEPLKVWIFDDGPTEGDRRLLKNYQQYSDQFTFEFVNPDRRPQLVQEFNVQSKGDVFVAYGDKKQLAQTLIRFDQREALSEIDLTNAIEKIRRTETPHVYILQGHGELPTNNEKDGLSEAIKSLENKGFVVSPLNLITDGGIPANANGLIIAGPEREFLPPERAALQEYINNGGNGLMMAGPQDPKELNTLLQSWGVRFDPRIVLDLSGAGSVLGLDPTIPVFNRYGNHPITAQFQGAIALFAGVRPVATEETANVTATTLMEASEAMYATPALTDPLQPNPETDLVGPFDVAVALERELPPDPAPQPSPSPQASPSPEGSPETIQLPKTSGDRPQTARWVVVGSTLFASNAWFNEGVNGDFFLNSVQWLAEDTQQPLSLRAKDPTDRRINLTSLQANGLGWLSWVIVPLLGLLLAVITWWRQR